GGSLRRGAPAPGRRRRYPAGCGARRRGARRCVGALGGHARAAAPGLSMRRFDVAEAGFDAAFQAFLDERRGQPEAVDAAAAEVIEEVKTRGLDAVLDYVRRFDK